LNCSSAQVGLEQLKNNESIIIKEIQNMRYFLKNRLFDYSFVIYNANIPLKDWSVESIKDSKVLSKLKFEKTITKKKFCKDIEWFSCEVYFVNSKVKNDYFFTDGDLFYTQYTDLDTILVDYLLNEKEAIFINILNLNSDIYFIIESNAIKKIFDRKLGKILVLESYLNNYSDNLKPNESFNGINPKIF